MNCKVSSARSVGTLLRNSIALETSCNRFFEVPSSRFNAACLDSPSRACRSYSHVAFLRLHGVHSGLRPSQACFNLRQRLQISHFSQLISIDCRFGTYWHAIATTARRRLASLLALPLASSSMSVRNCFDEETFYWLLDLDAGPTLLC